MSLSFLGLVLRGLVMSLREVVVTLTRVFSQRRWAFSRWAIGSFSRMRTRWGVFEQGRLTPGNTRHQGGIGCDNSLACARPLMGGSRLTSRERRQVRP